MEKVKLIDIIYASAATVDFNKDDIRRLLERSRTHNKAHNISGMLLYYNRSFFQIIEGPEDEIEKLYKRIEKDNRHNLVKLITEEIPQRDFKDWTMGFADITYSELGTIPGLNDFFKEGKCYCDLQKGRAKDLLHAFRSGKWRLKLN